MSDINVKRIEKRYLSKDFKGFMSALEELGFEKEDYSSSPITFTYFCDTDDLDLPESDRIKIRSYTAVIPEEIDYESDYKMNFKYHDEGDISRKESHKGRFQEMLNLASEKKGMDIKAKFGVAYKREHWVVSGRDDIRFTIDHEIEFFEVQKDGSLKKFYDFGNPLIEAKLDEGSEFGRDALTKIIEKGGLVETVSKKITMYEEYEKYLNQN